MMTIDSKQLTELLRDPIIIRIVSIIDIASLSILELLEYDLTHTDINHALSDGVISIDKSPYSDSASVDTHIDQRNILATWDYYFYNFLNRKVKLTEIGMYILESINGEKRSSANVPKELEEQKGQLSEFSSSPDLFR